MKNAFLPMTRVWLVIPLLFSFSVSLAVRAEEAPALAAQSALSAQSPQPAQPAGNHWNDKLDLSGSLWVYYFSQDNNFFNNRLNDKWIETIGRLGVDASLTDHIAAQVHIIGENTAGDADDYTGVLNDAWNVELELANITYKEAFDWPLDITVGRQNLQFGDGFVMWDGYFDPRAVWVNPINSFHAARATYRPSERSTVDAFVAEGHRNYLSYETFLRDFRTYTGRRHLWGANYHVEPENLGKWDVLALRKVDKSQLQSNTTALSLRGEYEFQTSLPLTLGGELVKEWGSTMASNHALSAAKQDRDALGGHIHAALSFPKVAFTPFIKGGYMHFSGDDPGTAENEAYDPVFYGWSDWGKWFVGSINSFNIGNTNENIVMGEVGLHPSPTTKLRAQYFVTDLEYEVTAGAGTDWSDEINLIFDWYPNDYFFAGAELGSATPKNAARVQYGLFETREIVSWAGVQF